MPYTLRLIKTFLLFLSLLLSCSENTTGPGKNTPDTTSHDFSWETFEFGGQNGSSILYDVAIINENDIWAVGEIYTEDTYTRDSLGNLIKPYNAVHWDGEEWELKRIPFVGACSAVEYPPIKALWAFSANNILFTNGGAIVKYDGNTASLDCGMNSLLTGAMNKIFAKDQSNIYAVGGSGTIVHYDGQGWTKLESGTDIDLTDVWGSPDGSVMWACGFDDLKGSVLLRKRDTQFETVAIVDDPAGPHPHNLISYVFESVWTDNPDSVYIGSTGRVYHTPVDYDTYALENIWFDYSQNGLPNFTKAIRGNNPHDIFIAGFQNFIRHYNGNTWRAYPEIMSATGYWYSLSVKGDVVAAAGKNSNQQAYIAVGRRSPPSVQDAN